AYRSRRRTSMSCGVWRRLVENWKRTVCATRGTEIKLPLVRIKPPSRLGLWRTRTSVRGISEQWHIARPVPPPDGGSEIHKRCIHTNCRSLSACDGEVGLFLIVEKAIMNGSANKALFWGGNIAKGGGT